MIKKIFRIIIFLLVVSLGIFLIKYTDSIIPENVLDVKNHSFILFIMWIFSPILILVFILYVLYLVIFRRPHVKK